MAPPWLESRFGTRKPIVAMLHLDALPGDPGYDHDAGLARVIEAARTDLRALQAGGVDAVMFSNEFSLPYLTSTEPLTAITMARVIGELRDEIRVPFGVNVLWDAIATIDLAVATGASFAREIFTGLYASDFGLWNTDIGAVARHRQRVGGQGVRLLCNIVPEGASALGHRDIATVTNTTVFNCRPDALCVSGQTAGSRTDIDVLSTVKDAAGDVPVFVNTGVRVETVEQQLGIADGAVVGTTFKRDGVFEQHVDPDRVTAFMEAVRRLR